MVWGLKFDRVNDYVDCGAGIRPSGDFEIDIDFVYDSAAANQVILGDVTDNEDVLRINSTTSVLIKPQADSNTVTLSVALVAGSRYQWRFKRTGTAYDITDWSDVSLLTASATSSSSFAFIGIGRILSASNYFGGTIALIWLKDLVTSSNDRKYDADASSGTGSSLPETINAGISDGTITNFPTDDSQWIILGGAGVSIETPSLDNSATTYAPTIAVSDHQSVEIPVSLHSITTYAPTISIGDSVSVEIPTRNNAATTYAPLITVSDHQSVEIPTLDNSATTYAPTFATTNNVSIEIPTSAHRITLYAPIASISNHINIEIPVSLHAITTYAPTITTAETADVYLQLSTPISADGISLITPIDITGIYLSTKISEYYQLQTPIDSTDISLSTPIDSSDILLSTPIRG